MKERDIYLFLLIRRPTVQVKYLFVLEENNYKMIATLDKDKQKMTPMKQEAMEDHNAFLKTEINWKKAEF